MDFKGELYSIMPIENVSSVMRQGILSNALAKVRIPNATSVAMQLIQEKRDSIQVPNGLTLHRYANLYFDPRNPMMYKIHASAAKICVLVVDDDVLKLGNVVLTDSNASSNYVRFLSPDQINEIDFEKVYASDWRHRGNPPAFYEHKSKKCAEVLIPDYVPQNYILGAHVVDQEAQRELEKAGFNHKIFVTPDMFFC